MERRPLEIAAPRPGEKRDEALIELARALDFWEREGRHAVYTVRHAAAPIARPVLVPTRMPPAGSVSVATLQRIHQQLIVESNL